MTSGVAGWTRESWSSQRFSNMGGEARSCSVREVPREEASMPPIVPSLGASTPESALDRLRPQVLLERQVAQLASVVEALGRLVAAGDQPGALLDALADVAAHALELDVGDERAQAGLLAERVARREGLRDRRGDLLGLGQPLARDEHARQRAARLAAVEEALGHAVGDRLLERRVVEDDVGRLAAELAGDRLDGLGGQLGDALARARGAGERDRVDSRVRGHGLADDRPVAGDEVEHARRDAELVEDLGEDERVERDDLA